MDESGLDTENAQTYRENAEAFLKELDRVDTEIKETFDISILRVAKSRKIREVHVKGVRHTHGVQDAAHLHDLAKEFIEMCRNFVVDADA